MAQSPPPLSLTSGPLLSTVFKAFIVLGFLPVIIPQLPTVYALEFLLQLQKAYIQLLVYGTG